MIWGYSSAGLRLYESKTRRGERVFYTYIIESISFGTFYIGQTNDLISRIKKHNAGQVSSTRNKKPYKLVYFEEFASRAEAMNREWEIKKNIIRIEEKNWFFHLMFQN